MSNEKENPPDVKVPCGLCQECSVLAQKDPQPGYCPVWVIRKGAPIPIEQRNCIMCKHWAFNGGFCGTDVTPGESWEAGCTTCDEKGNVRWTLYGGDADTSDWRKAIRMAETCGDFKPVEEK